MGLRRDILLGVVLLATLHAVLSFGAIGLFSRMAPEIERILQANVVSLEACEDMLAALAQGPREDTRRAFEAALAAARTNITEPSEMPLLATIETRHLEALSSYGPARDATMAAIVSLSEVNRTAMRRSDDEAKRLGTAGSWAAVFLAMTSFVASVVVIRRLRRKVVVPLERIYETLVAVRRGNLHRRCQLQGTSAEIARLAAEVNELVERLSGRAAAPTAGRTKDSLNRAMLLHALDALPGPAAFVSSRGDMLASNRAALELLSGPDAAVLVEALGRVGSDATVSPELIESATKASGADLWLCVLKRRDQPSQELSRPAP